MRPRIKVLTLGVDDLDASLAFYRDGLGLATEGIIGTEFEDGAVVFFEMNDDMILA
ncbi:MAG: VOC family protein, partial [Actinomycetota bacterium]|nr:VOC family protein [Actinomycetota bacterium]